MARGIEAVYNEMTAKDETATPAPQGDISEVLAQAVSALTEIVTKLNTIAPVPAPTQEPTSDDSDEGETNDEGDNAEEDDE